MRWRFANRIKSSLATAMPPVSAPIVRGPLRGAHWTLNSRGKVLRVLTGTYEPLVAQWFARYVGPGSVVWDIGACSGYYTLMASRLAGSSGQVLAVQPAPNNVANLLRNISINRCRNVQVVSAAAGDRCGPSQFGGDCGSATGQLCREGDVTVDVFTLDWLAARGKSLPSLVKLDVEGHEAAVLRGATGLLCDVRPVILLSTHGRRGHTESLSILQRYGYAVRQELTYLVGPQHSAEVLLTIE